MINTTSRRYAQAFFDRCQDRNELELVHEDILKIATFIKSSNELQNFLSNEGIPSKTRQEILKNVFREKLKPLSFVFLLFLEKKGRLNLISHICIIFQELYLHAKNILHVKITSSIELKNTQITKIMAQLKHKFKKDIKPEPCVDPKILGGIKIKVGDTIYDYSFQGELERFREKLVHS